MANCCFATSKKSWKPFEERYSKGGGSTDGLNGNISNDFNSTYWRTKRSKY